MFKEEKIRARTERMKQLHELSDGDAEATHGEADEILVEIAKESGYKELAEYFEDMGRWYA
jgi:hypothetical protein